MFAVKVNGIQVKELPTLDDEFAKDVSEYDTLEALRDAKRQELLEQAEKNAKIQKENDVVRVFLSGDRESRIHHLMEKHKVKRHEAESVIEKTESRRKQYHMYYTGEDWGYAANYDLCINDTRFGIEGTADIIMQYVKDCNAQEK